MWSCSPISLVDQAMLILNLFLKILCDMAENGERRNREPFSLEVGEYILPWNRRVDCRTDANDSCIAFALLVMHCVCVSNHGSEISSYSTMGAKTT